MIWMRTIRIIISTSTTKFICIFYHMMSAAAASKPRRPSSRSKVAKIFSSKKLKHNVKRHNIKLLKIQSKFCKSPKRRQQKFQECWEFTSIWSTRSRDTEWGEWKTISIHIWVPHSKFEFSSRSDMAEEDVNKFHHSGDYSTIRSEFNWDFIN